MRYLILSDIHSNLPALECCLTMARSLGYERTLCCGDLVGYGPEPGEVIDRIRELDTLCIRGNHDRVVAEAGEPEGFNHYARVAVEWTRSVLGREHKEFLASLPVGPVAVDREGQLVHGSIVHEDDYIFTEEDADVNFPRATRRVTFFGHSHIPGVFSFSPDGQSAIEFVPERNGVQRYRIDRRPYLINPGSVGQPRDGRPEASFAIWDSSEDTVSICRAAYPVEVTQERILKLGLPEYLARRLSSGR